MNYYDCSTNIVHQTKRVSRNVDVVACNDIRGGLVFATTAEVTCPECLKLLASEQACEHSPEPDLYTRCRKRIEEMTPSRATDAPEPYTLKPRRPARCKALEDVARLNRLFCDQVLQEWDAKDPSEITPAENTLLDFLRGVRERNDEALRTTDET